MKKRRICVVTGSRADYGLLSTLMRLIKEDGTFILQVAVTGSHLSPEFGYTYKVIEKDGFRTDCRVEMLLSSDSPAGIGKSTGLGTIGFADCFERLKPDLVVLLGDRYEILAACQAALIARIPTAHIAGGDVTEGAFDEAIRHSITKMSHIHFATNADAALRIRQMGEDPDHIFNVGSPGIDLIKNMKLLDRKSLSGKLKFKFLARNILVTFHPESLSNKPAEPFAELLKALDRLGKDVGIIITRPNSDTENRSISRMIDEFTASHPGSAAYTSLGQLLYLSALAQVDAVVGNSSSGLYEVPSFKKPTVNIGDRQKGRLRAESVIDCPAEANAILKAIQKAMSLDCSAAFNPYGTGNSSEKILQILKDFRDFSSLVRKKFFDLRT